MDYFEKYITPTKKDKIILVVAGIIFLICGTVFLIRKSILLMIVMYLGGLVLVYAAITATAKQKAFIEDMKSRNQYETVVKDFQNATAAAGGRLMLGEQFIFREKLPDILRYEDIAQAQYFERFDHDTNRTERSIVMKLTNGKSRTLCDLYEESYMEDASEILTWLQTKNPLITIKNQK